jgi:hypothetical protein
VPGRGVPSRAHGTRYLNQQLVRKAKLRSNADYLAVQLRALGGDSCPELSKSSVFGAVHEQRILRVFNRLLRQETKALTIGLAWIVGAA